MLVRKLPFNRKKYKGLTREQIIRTFEPGLTPRKLEALTWVLKDEKYCKRLKIKTIKKLYQHSPQLMHSLSRSGMNKHY
jgi:hypothetical protein